jgi:hypothetical protein
MTSLPHHHLLMMFSRPSEVNTPDLLIFTRGRPMLAGVGAAAPRPKLKNQSLLLNVKGEQ